MKLFLTSSPCNDDVPEGVHIPCILNEANQFVSQMTRYWKPDSRGLIISSDPDNYDLNDEMRDTFYKAFSFHGLSLCRLILCDSRNEADIAQLVADSDMIILGGGHVPTQNAFFKRMGLRKLLQGYQGIIMGISAGTMNCADTVYVQPEMPGESIDLDYQRFIPGLGLTDVMILPHYQQVKDYTLDGMRLFEDITYGDSWGHQFYALVDGSYVLADEYGTELYGEAYLIQDGQVSQVCHKEEEISLKI